MDQLLVNYAGSSCALGIYPACGFYCVSNTANHDADSSCTRVPSTADSPFGDSWVMSIGFACTMLVVVPLSFLNLDDNIGVQIVSFMCLLAITIEWIWQFRSMGLERGDPPAVGDEFSNLFGNVLFNFAFVLTIPSW